MKRFDILNPLLPIHQNYVLEASAGTGKTFSIENLLVRLLIEKDPLTKESYTLDKILVMTFTKAAARELKERIRQTIYKSISQIDDWLEQDGLAQEPPNHYLEAIRIKGNEALILAKRQLEQALFTYDQAHISTIHGFCQRLLKEELFTADWLGREDDSSQGTLSNNLLRTYLRDFIRTELSEDIVSAGQLQLLDWDFTEEENVLIKMIQQGPIKPPPICYKDLWQNFNLSMQRLVQLQNWEAGKIEEDFIAQVDQYKKAGYREKLSTDEMIERVRFFAQLLEKKDWNNSDFDRLIVDKVAYVQALAPELAKKKVKPAILNYPHLWNALSEVNTLVESAGNLSIIYANLAYYAQQHVNRIVEEEEIYSHDVLIRNMQKAAHEPAFAEQVKTRFNAVIIDEFQDTDPIQWDIFKTLFMGKQSVAKLYLVGDPKQSIYSFRQADIYTYLEAANALGEDCRASLDTNFRSQPSLVEALNALFAAKQVPGMIGLPRLSSALDCPAVKTSERTQALIIDDELGDVHFCIADETKQKVVEEQYFFPFIASEILKLRELKHIAFGQWAILIRDAFQAERLSVYLKKCGIESSLLKDRSLSESRAIPALLQVLHAVIEHNNQNKIKAALGTKLFGWTHQQVGALNEEQSEKILAEFLRLHREFHAHGFQLFFEELLKLRFSSVSLAEKMLLQQDGADYLRELMQIAEALTDYENENDATPLEVCTYLTRLSQNGDENEEKLIIQNDASKESVKILTIHSSKGLEFDFVFALGLAQRESKRKEWLFPTCSTVEREFEPITDENSLKYAQYRAEINAEKMRQLYVAMTRAKYRLYVPIIDDQKELSELASPIDLYLSHFIGGLGGLCKYIDDNRSTIRFSYHRQEKSPQILKYTSDESAPALVPPKPIEINFSNRFMHSFTTLAKESGKMDHQEQPPHNFFHPEKNPHTLPAGSDTGLILHALVEKIPVSFIKKANAPKDLVAFVGDLVENTSYKDWCDVLCEVVYSAWKTVLKGTNFSLSEVDPDLMFREMEFLYPTNGMQISPQVRDHDLLKGVVDLFFQHDDKYYIVDWKTNWLGPSSEHYRGENIQKAIDVHHYHLQAAIYREAFKRYISLFDKRPFNEIFGGCYYLFLRGLQPWNSYGMHICE